MPPSQTLAFAYQNHENLSTIRLDLPDLPQNPNIDPVLVYKDAQD